MYYREGMKARVSPVQSIEPHRILAPTRDLNRESLGPQSRVVTTIPLLHTYSTSATRWSPQLLLLSTFFIINFCSPCMVCSVSVVVTAYDFEFGLPGSNPEWGPIYYEASITAQGLPEPSSLWGSTLGTRAAEHEGCNWGMQFD